MAWIRVLRKTTTLPGPAADTLGWAEQPRRIRQLTMRPLIGITADAEADRFFSRRPYARAVVDAGGLPLLLPHHPELAGEYVARCDGLILSGGDDPIMERFGISTHPNATPIDPGRQAFEIALLEALDEAPDVPVLGICLGMQLMGLAAGGCLDQHLPDTLPTADRHWGKVVHGITGSLGTGEVLSHHRQALTDAGTLVVAAVAPDGVIEAIRDEGRRFYVGVQWHPERTEDPALGAGVLRELVRASEGGRSRV
jgi:putative glutamine amidotransferase